MSETAVRHFLSLSDVSRKELATLIDEAISIKKLHRDGRRFAPLAGRSIGMLFEKPSTRTRVSFEVGIGQLGAHPLYIARDTTQISRGEPIKDVARVFSRYLDAIVMRVYEHATLLETAEYSSIPVINGLSEKYHPCQLLADLLTVKERSGTLESLRFCWVGDGNNMAQSWINAAAILGLDLIVTTPEGYAPNADVLREAQAMNPRIRLTHDPQEAVTDADVISTDVWTSMGDEAEEEQRNRAFSGFQLNEMLLIRARDRHMVLHCLPAHRGLEISEDTLETHATTIFEQAENRLHAQKALLCTLLRSEEGD